MKNYIVNTTFVTYMSDIHENEFFQYVETIREVKEEILHLRRINDIEIDEIKKENADLIKDKAFGYLSDVDCILLETSKAHKKILVTDDKKLVKTAMLNEVMVLNTPRLITTLAFNGAISYEKALDTLQRLRVYYNRKKALDKVIKDLENWR